MHKVLDDLKQKHGVDLSGVDNPDFIKTVVEDTVALFNERTRNSISEKLRFNLKSGKIVNQITVEVSDDYPQSFDDLIKTVGGKDELYEIFYLWSKLKNIENATDYLLKRQDLLEDIILKIERLDDKENLLKTDRRLYNYREWFGPLGNAYQKVTAVLQLLDILIDKFYKILHPNEGESGEDILGQYFYSNGAINKNVQTSGKILIYWKPIAIASFVLEDNIRELTRIVLAHEFVHGYSHLGFDSDGERWVNFVNCDTDIVEGVAQFYTHKFVEDTKERGLIRAYIKLTTNQSPAYQRHLDWIEKGNKNEAVRRAIQLSVASNLNKIDDFEKNLK